jgi:hypothetical protein
LNRKDVIQESRGTEPPLVFINNLYAQLDRQEGQPPRGTTPAYGIFIVNFLGALEASFRLGVGRKVSRYFMGDGLPNHGEQPRIEHLIKNRRFPQQNPMTFLSCTNEDDQVEWM